MTGITYSTLENSRIDNTKSEEKKTKILIPEDHGRSGAVRGGPGRSGKKLSDLPIFDEKVRDFVLS